MSEKKINHRILELEEALKFIDGFLEYMEVPYANLCSERVRLVLREKK